ncbi:MAG: TonB C-terminal domain-containing protein [Myxococcales bacterium]|nr:TonB C-terminal domain-containing protein [Myxococcales bacterium]
MTLLLMGCGKAPPAAAAPPSEEPVEVAPDDGDEDDDGPIAGPRNVLEAAPRPPPADDLPGTGPLVAYFGAVRTQVGEPFQECLRATFDGRSESPALVRATFDADGVVVDVELVRTSGSDGLDGCALAAFRAAKADPPPPGSLDASGTLTSPPMAFVP